MTTANDVLRSLRLPTLEDIKWVQCPSCRHEWTKLHPCQFWWDGKEQVAHICVRCAEGVGAFDWIKSHWPSEHDPAVTIKKLPAFFNMSEADIPPSGWLALIDLKEKNFKITARSGDYPIKVESDGVETFYRNAIAAWMAIRKILGAKPELAGGSSW